MTGGPDWSTESTESITILGVRRVLNYVTLVHLLWTSASYVRPCRNARLTFNKRCMKKKYGALKHG